jgi:hypothetical protein
MKFILNKGNHPFIYVAKIFNKYSFFLQKRNFNIRFAKKYTKQR